MSDCSIIEIIRFELKEDHVLVTYSNGYIYKEDYDVDENGKKYFDMNNLNRKPVYLN